MKIMLDVPSPWQFILDALNWLKDLINGNLRGASILFAIIAAVILGYYFSKFTRWLKNIIGNLATPVGFLFFIMSLLVLLSFLYKFGII